MSQTEISTSSDSDAARQGDSPIDQVSTSEPGKPIGHKQKYRVLTLVAAASVLVLALLFLAASGWALWMDQIDRDSNGFIDIGGTTELHTGTHAIVSELRGDGPGWLYGSTVLGDARVRVTSQNGAPLFIGIARADDVSEYLNGTGYATIKHFVTGELTTHAGDQPSTQPAQSSIWAASTEGSGEQTLVWRPRGGDWSIVLMNADASSGVAVKGGVAAKVPLLPWLAGALLIAGVMLAFLGGWLLVRQLQAGTQPNLSAGGHSPGSVSPGSPTES